MSKDFFLLNTLTAASSVSTILCTSSSSEDAQIPRDLLVEYFLSKVESKDQEQKLPFTPANGGTIDLSAQTGSEFKYNWVLLTPVSSISGATIKLPTAPSDKMEFNLSTTNTITTITYTYPSGYAGNGVPTTITTTAPFRIKFDSTSKLWFKI